MPPTPQTNRRTLLIPPKDVSSLSKREVSLELACALALHATLARNAPVAREDEEDADVPALSDTVSTDNESQEAVTPDGSISDWSVQVEKDKMRAALTLCGLGLQRV